MIADMVVNCAQESEEDIAVWIDACKLEEITDDLLQTRLKTVAKCLKTIPLWG